MGFAPVQKLMTLFPMKHLFEATLEQPYLEKRERLRHVVEKRAASDHEGA
jgi:hypothetical protein